MAEELSKHLPYPLVYKVTAKTNKEITDIVKEVNYEDSCAGIITWCHTFSPSKMWINGLANLQKPYCHFATQYNEVIPNDEIDMVIENMDLLQPDFVFREKLLLGIGRMQRYRNVSGIG